MKILFVEPYEYTLLSFRKELLDHLIEEGHEIYLCVSCTERILNLYSDKVKQIFDVKLNLKDKSIFNNLKIKKEYKRI